MDQREGNFRSWGSLSVDTLLLPYKLLPVVSALLCISSSTIPQYCILLFLFSLSVDWRQECRLWASRPFPFQLAILVSNCSVLLEKLTGWLGMAMLEACKAEVATYSLSQKRKISKSCLLVPLWKGRSSTDDILHHISMPGKGLPVERLPVTAFRELCQDKN